jgi:hypothetical protein
MILNLVSPPHRVVEQLHQLLGELRSWSSWKHAVLFSVLQEAPSKCNNRRDRLNPRVRS